MPRQHCMHKGGWSIGVCMLQKSGCVQCVRQFLRQMECTYALGHAGQGMNAHLCQSRPAPQVLSQPLPPPQQWMPRVYCRDSMHRQAGLGMLEQQAAPVATIGSPRPTRRCSMHMVAYFQKRRAWAGLHTHMYICMCITAYALSTCAEACRHAPHSP